MTSFLVLVLLTQLQNFLIILLNLKPRASHSRWDSTLWTTLLTMWAQAMASVWTTLRSVNVLGFTWCTINEHFVPQKVYHKNVHFPDLKKIKKKQNWKCPTEGIYLYIYIDLTISLTHFFVVNLFLGHISVWDVKYLFQNLISASMLENREDRLLEKDILFWKIKDYTCIVNKLLFCVLFYFL